MKNFGVAGDIDAKRRRYLLLHAIENSTYSPAGAPERNR
jgi:hypothetical protein